MPTHKIHLAVANKVNEQLKMDLDSIMLGSVLPDICLEEDPSICFSCFQKVEKME